MDNNSPLDFEIPLFLIALLLLASTYGCGGGGGGDTSVIPGVWIGSLSLIDNSCPDLAPEDKFLSFSHLINQDGQDVVVDNGIQTFIGKTTAENSFEAELNRNVSTRPACRETLSWRYEKMTETQAPFVIRRRRVDCGTSFGTCSSSWSGTAFNSEKSGGFPYPLYEGASANAPAGLQSGIADAQSGGGSSNSGSPEPLPEPSSGA